MAYHSLVTVIFYSPLLVIVVFHGTYISTMILYSSGLITVILMVTAYKPISQQLLEVK